MNRIGLVVAVSMLALVAACSADDDSSSFLSADGAPPSAAKGASDESGGSSSAPVGGPTSASGSSSSGSTATKPASPEDPSADKGNGVQSGTLTAGVWDDNLNFDFFTKYTGLAETNLQGLPIFTTAERQNARAQWTGTRAGATEIDIAFMLDTTGSMGDELKYIQAEVDGIASTIKAKHPQLAPRYGLVLYRDLNDTYVTQSSDFSDLATFKSKLAGASVNGGGDYPEAVQLGLSATLALGWRGAGVAKMAFWVADAPHHMGDEGSVKTSITDAAAKGIKIYPVAASGTDDRAEYTMRTAAQMTGGRYVFLTDDSKVGNSHAEPHIPCYHVTRFDGALVRMVESELSGAHISPDPKEIIRSVGNPQNGQCVTTSAGNVVIY